MTKFGGGVLVVALAILAFLLIARNEVELKERKERDCAARSCSAGKQPILMSVGRYEQRCICAEVPQ